MSRTGAAFTLVEVIITLVIGAMLILALTRIFSSGIQTSQKGSNHLTNMQAASLLLSQMEKDFSALTMIRTAAGDASGKFSCDIASDYGSRGMPASATIIYEPEPGQIGFRRTEVLGSTSGSKVFARDLAVQVRWDRLVVSPGGRIGFAVEISVSTPPGMTEKNTLRRFVYCYNLPENRGKSPQNWKF
jgi:type II secretory pathway component PulJ